MISFQPHALPLRTPYRWAKGEQHVRRGVIVRVEIEGAAGFGEIAPPIHEAVDEESLAACAAALVEGLDIVAPSFLQDLDTRNVHPRIRSGIVTAWLSARASLHGVSLGRFLAGCSRLPAATVPINGLVTEAEPAAAAERVRSLLTEGYSTLKIKCTADRVGDIKRLDAIREVAPRARLRLDANESWPAEWSLEHLHTVAQFNIEYVEQPLPHDETVEALVRLRARSPIPIALDESACDLPTIQR
ncbi:MAG: enolase C-terminal domain-like protein, partial [Vulcanimicrobiaceae bacterium]